MLKHLNPEPQNPERVVVMGGGSFLGRAILRRAAATGIEAVSLTRADVDLLEEGAGERLTGFLRPGDAFVAVAAIAPCKDMGMLRDNLRIVEALSMALATQPLSYILNIGSDAIYADSDQPLTEGSCASPGSLHGIMHLAREVVLREAAGDSAFGTLRPTLVYGIEDPHNGYGPNRFRRLAEEGEKIVLFGEGEERRDHVWVEDVADLAVRMLRHRSVGALNAATGTVISFREIAELVRSLSKAEVAIQGSPRNGVMPHNGYRPFDPVATFAAFPDFHYTQPAEGFARVHEGAAEPT